MLRFYLVRSNEGQLCLLNIRLKAFLLDLLRAGSGKPELSYATVMWLLGASHDALSVLSSLTGCSRWVPLPEHGSV